MNPFDSITSFKDTISAEYQAFLDSIQLDSMGAEGFVIPLRPEDGDTVQKAYDGVLHIGEWPLTLWGDSITAPASLFNELNNFGEPLPYSVFRDTGVMGILLGCFIVLVTMIALTRDYLSYQAHNFFTPTNTPDTSYIKAPIESYLPIIMCTIMCAYNGLLLFAGASHKYDLLSGILTPPMVLGCCIGCFAAYYALRWILYSFVNWVFFPKEERSRWDGGFTFLITLESIIFLPIILFSLNNGWDIKTTTIIAIISYSLIRIMLLYHSFCIFFPKIYGLLHLFAYLCTLELIPLLTLWKILAVFSEELITK